MSNINKQAQYESKFSRLWERYDEASHGNAEQMRDILEVTLDALESAERQILRLEKLAEALEARDKQIAEMQKPASKPVAQIEVVSGVLVRERWMHSSLTDGWHDLFSAPKPESRTVTVKLPSGTGWASDPYNHGRNDGISECAKELRAAGINVEAE
ncbi:TPA: hypothetical protein I8Y10_000619 [Kluyvera cryocrescens]|nr:hypothetical protein [Kluyvera cryocrescens]